MKKLNEILNVKKKIKLLESQIFHLMEGKIELCDLENLKSIIVKKNLTNLEKRILDVIKTASENKPISLKDIGYQAYGLSGYDIERRVITHITRIKKKVRESGSIIKVQDKGYYFKSLSKPFDPTLLGFKECETDIEDGFLQYELLNSDSIELYYVLKSRLYTLINHDKPENEEHLFVDVKIPDHDFGVKLISQFLGVE